MNDNDDKEGGGEEGGEDEDEHPNDEDEDYGDKGRYHAELTRKIKQALRINTNISGGSAKFRQFLEELEREVIETLGEEEATPIVQAVNESRRVFKANSCGASKKILKKLLKKWLHGEQEACSEDADADDDEDDHRQEGGALQSTPSRTTDSEGGGSAGGCSAGGCSAGGRSKRKGAPNQVDEQPSQRPRHSTYKEQHGHSLKPKRSRAAARGSNRPKKHRCTSSAPIKQVVGTTPVVGTVVEAQFKGRKRYYPGKVKAVNADGSYEITYDAGDNEKSVNRDSIRERELPSPRPHRVPRPIQEDPLYWEMAVGSNAVYEADI
jgi:hypothetical protein